MSDNSISPPNNGAVLTVAKIIKEVMSSAAEAELGALYINCDKQSQNGMYWKKWDIPNHKLQWTRTTPQHLELSPTLSNQKGQKSWTCNFIGYNAKQAKGNSGIIGIQDQATKQIMSQSITRKFITASFTQNI